MQLKGLGVSQGVAAAKTLVLHEPELKIGKKNISDHDAEVKRFKKALDQAAEDLKKIHQKTLKTFGADKAAIFEAHLLILEDPELISQTEHLIHNEQVNAEFAFSQVVDTFLEIFAQMEDDYLKDRASDIKDVSSRVLCHLTGQEILDISALDEPVILVAKDLVPSQTSTMDKSKVVGFITEVGGKNSHTAILARSLEIPAVSGVKELLSKIKNNQLTAIDGSSGLVHTAPDTKLLQEFEALRAKYLADKKELQQFIGRQTRTQDAHQVLLFGNVTSPDDMDFVKKNDAEGIGLFRTEFVYMNHNSFPNEEEQYHIYKKVVEAMAPRPTVIRTMDIGGDKDLPYLNISKEMNPFLGYRAIRMCLDKKEMFQTQLRAIVRASAHGPTKIMFPMITTLEELLACKEALAEAQASLKIETQISVGIMIEVPAAAIMSDQLAKHCDFFSIGTNDLIQYTVAADRMNDKVAYLYSHMQPGVLRLIQTVIENAHKNKIEVAMCGEMAADPQLIPLLIGMGLEEFSMNGAAVLKNRRLIAGLDYKKCQKLAEQLPSCATAEDVKKLLSR